MKVRVRVLPTMIGVAAGVGMLASAALAYGPKVPPGAAPAPKSGAGPIVSSAAPQPVKKTKVSSTGNESMTYSAPSSNPKVPTTLKVDVPPNTFIEPGTVTLEVSNSQNLATLQSAVGNGEQIITVFSLNSQAKTQGPMIVRVTSPDIFFGKFSVFAIRPNGNGKGYHLVYVKPKLVDGTYQFVANRNEPYVLVQTTTN